MEPNLDRFSQRMWRERPNLDRFYPDYLHWADVTPDELPDDDWCDGCDKPGSYCECP
jgi:hypothetical protein